ncbi:MAG: helix-turn-helix transcriptional regulator [Firmicutes bacterium]|jgi:transcriptional regulator with XRE-family HTH domain|nr:helix-turn-helix transcriptional regulator [Bacillota bacterium]
MDELLMLVASRFRMKRHIEDMPIKTVAEKLDVSPSHISSIELGKAKLSLRMYIALCDLYHLDPGKFLNTVIADHDAGVTGESPKQFFRVLKKQNKFL